LKLKEEADEILADNLSKLQAAPPEDLSDASFASL
jgi:hypothetical protein